MSQKLLPSAFSDVVTPPSSVKRRKGRPMIVDISINDQGEQVYQVHSSTRGTKRKRLALDLDDGYDVERSAKRMTPVRSILGTISPSTLNQDKRTIDPSKRSNLTGSPSTRKTEEANIWSEEVEEAFEDALRMIPKNGLTKIKVSGKSCGRNELISDYILQKTGKLRTRKQVSSHIQVIKNLKKKPDLIELINNGPTDPEDIKKFEEVFTEIFFQKSLGSNGSMPSQPNRSDSPDNCTPRRGGSPRKSTPRQQSRKTPKKCPSVKKSERPSRIPLSYKPVSCNLKKFEMVHADLYEPMDSLIYTKLSPRQSQALRLKPDASVQTRFPNLTDYSQEDLKADQQIHILHNLVNLNLPSCDKKLGGSHETALEVELKGVAPEETDFGVVTTIYSFGNEVIELVEDVETLRVSPSRCSNMDHTLRLPFAKEFWSAFLSSIENNVNNQDDPVRADNQKTIAVKAVTMKQIIYSKGTEFGFEKGDIKSIILWEFTRATETCETTTRRLYLPSQPSPHPELTLLSKHTEPVSEHSIDPHQPPMLQLNCDVGPRVPHMITPTVEEDDTSSANSTLQFDDLDHNDIVPISQSTFRTNSFPEMYQSQPLTLQVQVRRMMSEPLAWHNGSNPPQQMHQSPHSHPQMHPHHPHPQMQTVTSDDGFNTDEFQGFHTYTTDTASLSMLNPGYMHLEHHPENYSW